MPPDFLLFDHDGVLVDTERWYFAATRDALARRGIDLTPERYLAITAAGRTSWDLAREQGADEGWIARARDERNAHYQRLLRTQPIEIEGVDDVLAELAGRHRLAIVTTSRRADFELIHRERSLLRHFEFALTVEDYPRAKPHPAPYLAALERFGARPRDALVVEDTARGLAAARAAGLDCIVVRTPFTRTEDVREAVCVVDSIRDVPDAVRSWSAAGA